MKRHDHHQTSPILNLRPQSEATPNLPRDDTMFETIHSYTKILRKAAADSKSLASTLKAENIALRAENEQLRTRLDGLDSENKGLRKVLDSP